MSARRGEPVALAEGQLKIAIEFQGVFLSEIDALVGAQMYLRGVAPLERGQQLIEMDAIRIARIEKCRRGRHLIRLGCLRLADISAVATCA